LECNSLSVCLALDESGSLCSNGTQPEECTGPSANCDLPDCPKFNIETKNFAKDFIDKLLDEADSQLQIDNANVQFSVVTFATVANVDINLTDSTNAKIAINNLNYSGGFTNTQEAIENCQNTLSLDPNGKKFILLFTDGVPTASDGLATRPDAIDRNRAEFAALTAREAPNFITLVTVLVSSVTTDTTFLNGLASNNLNFTADNFSDVSAITANLVQEILEECPSAAPSTIPSGIPSSDPSNSPSRIPSNSPSRIPSNSPSRIPSEMPSPDPSEMPSPDPSGIPSTIPSGTPSLDPSGTPSLDASGIPSLDSSNYPSTIPSKMPSIPSKTQSPNPSVQPPSKQPTGKGYIGKGYSFGKGSDFGKGFTFGKGSDLGKGIFGKGSSFGEGYNFGKGFNTGNGYDYGDYFNNFGKGYTNNFGNGGYGARNLLNRK